MSMLKVYMLAKWSKCWSNLGPVSMICNFKSALFNSRSLMEKKRKFLKLKAIGSIGIWGSTERKNKPLSRTPCSISSVVLTFSLVYPRREIGEQQIRETRMHEEDWAHLLREFCHLKNQLETRAVLNTFFPAWCMNSDESMSSNWLWSSVTLSHQVRAAYRGTGR